MGRPPVGGWAGAWYWACWCTPAKSSALPHGRRRLGLAGQMAVFEALDSLGQPVLLPLALSACRSRYLRKHRAGSARLAYV